MRVTLQLGSDQQIPAEPHTRETKKKKKKKKKKHKTHVVVGKVTALKHETGNDTVERGASVAVALLTSGKSTEVGGRLGDNIIVELEGDAAKGSYMPLSR